MSLPANNATVETTMNFTHALTGKKSAMVFVNQMTVAPPPDLTDLEDLNDIYNSWMSAAIFGANSLQPLVHPNFVLTSSASRRVIGAGPTWETPTSLPGTRAGEQMPDYCTLVVTQLTEDGGRHFTGRKYPPGPVEADNVNGRPTSAYGNALVAAFDALQTTLAGSPPGWLQVVLSRVAGGAPRPTPIFDEVIRHRVDLQWDTQRRRGRS